MKLSELQNLLGNFITVHGDLEVYTKIEYDDSFVCRGGVVYNKVDAEHCHIEFLDPEPQSDSSPDNPLTTIPVFILVDY